MKTELIKKYWKVLVICLSMVLLIGGAFIVRSRNKEAMRVRIAVVEQPAFALVFIADEKGYFKEEGLEVELKRYVLGRDALADAIKGEADLATVYDVPVVTQILKGENLGILTTLHTSNKNLVVAALKNRGIEKGSDLKGKRLAMTKGTNAEVFLNFYLIEEGINQDEVNIVSLEPDRYIKSLKEGTVDAVVLFSPYPNLLKKEVPDEQITWLHSSVFHESSVLVGKKEVIDNQPEKINKVLKALYKAENYIKSNREDSIRLVDDFLPSYGKQAIESDWDIFRFTLEISNSGLNDMEKQINFLNKKEIYFNDVPFLRKYFLTQYLEAIKPEGNSKTIQLPKNS